MRLKRALCVWQKWSVLFNYLSLQKNKTAWITQGGNMVSMKGKDILDGAQFTRDEIDYTMALADDFRGQIKDKPAVDLMKGYVLATLFFEPSTRPRLSFETAMHRLGGNVVGFR